MKKPPSPSGACRSHQPLSTQPSRTQQSILCASEAVARAPYVPPCIEQLGHWQVHTLDTMSVPVASLGSLWRGG